MNSRGQRMSLVAGCIVALALGGAACNKKAANDKTALDKTGHEGAPITLTGCVQKGDGLDNYVLTQVNSPAESSVATSGGASGGSVQNEQMRAAKHSYELSGHHDDLRDMVGKQVRVTGTIAENSDLNKTDRDRKTDIDANDLAKVDVQTVERSLTRAEQRRETGNERSAQSAQRSQSLVFSASSAISA